MLREYLNVMGHSGERERLEHISTQLQHTRTKEQVITTAIEIVGSVFVYCAFKELKKWQKIFEEIWSLAIIWLYQHWSCPHFINNIFGSSHLSQENKGNSTL